MAKDVRRALMIASEPLKVPSTYASMDPDARAAWKTDQMAREGHGSFSPPGTPEREENFNRWHGNSKIRDGEGNPLRLYHATPKSFDTFIPGGPNPANEMPSGPATWLSPYPDKQPAGHHVGGFEDKFKSGANVMPVHADIRNPLVIDNKSMRDWARQSYAKGSGEFPLLISPESRKMLLEDGYDGILWAGFDATAKDEAFYDDHGIGEHPSKDEEIIALHPPGRAQIKSAIGNRGQYDPEDMHVNYARGGDVGVKRALMIAKAEGGEVENDLLRPIGASRSVGDEKPLFDEGVHKAGEAGWPGPNNSRSIRYLHHDENDTPIGALQIRTHGPRTKKATIQNVYVAEGARRKGIAASLLKRARQDFDVAHSTDLTRDGRAFARAVKAHGGAAESKEVKRALMIARDQRALLRRIANIYPGPGGGMDPSPGGGGYSGPGGGKYIGPSRYADGGPVPPFKLHSGAAKIIGAKGQKKATPQQYAAMPGIKPDELKHSKFDTLGSKALPREEVIKHLEDNAVPLQESELRDEQPPNWDGETSYTASKFSEHTLPGGENYREVLLHTPPAASDGFRGNHWDQPNVLAHVRMSDRKGPNGEKILHLEESQSDWGQQGREQGFQQPARQLTPAEDTELAELFDRVPEMRNGSPEIARYNELRNIARGQVANAQGLPSAPYVDNTQKWTDLALKRVLHEAAHGGYDKIVVTPGDEQNKRYDLSRQVKNISYFPDIGYLNGETHDGKGLDEHDVKPGDLAKHIGKEAADRILKQNPQRYEGRGRLGGEFYHELEGDGLKMGGAGMRGYYDNILPKRLQALAQQHDPQAKVNLHAHPLKDFYVKQSPGYQGNDFEAFTPDDASLGAHPTREAAEAAIAQRRATPGNETAPLHSLDVTPQMRDSIKGNGFNSFKRGGEVGDDPIKDWQWRPTEDVRNELQLDEIPSHVHKFGEFMDESARKAMNEGFTPRDLIKAYTITRASIQRRAQPVENIRKSGLILPPDLKGMLRPEGAFGHWLHTKHGQRYLDEAEAGRVDEEAIADAQKIMKPYGKTEKDLPDALRWAPKNLPGQEGRISELVTRAYRGHDHPDDWRDATSGLRGIGPAKQGFYGANLGYGKLPTLDARQIIAHTGRPTSEAVPYLNVKGAPVAAVNRLSDRQTAMKLKHDKSMSPFYQHLAHHTTWDKAAGEQTTHEDVISPMRGAKDGGRQGYKKGGGAEALSVLDAHPVMRALVEGLPYEAFLPTMHANMSDLLNQAGVVRPYEGSREDVEKSLKIAQDNYLMQTGVGSGKDPSRYYNIRQPTAARTVTTRIAGLRNRMPKPQIDMSWEKFGKIGEGGTAINLAGDRTRIGTLGAINNKKLNWPVHLYGGPEYIREGQRGTVWANNAGVATGLRNTIRKLSQRGPVYGIYAPMSAVSGDQAHHMFDAVMAQIDPKSIDKQHRRAFDEAMRSGAFIMGQTDDVKKDRARVAEKMKKWPGIDNPKEASKFALESLAGVDRKAIIQYLDKKMWADRGFPHIGVTRAAITDPSVRDIHDNTIGGHVALLDPDQLDRQPSGNPTYPEGISGKYVGTLPYVQKHYAAPVSTAHLVTTPTAGKGKLSHPFSVDDRARSSYRKLYEQNLIPEPIGQRMVESASEGLEKQKLYGLKSGGRAGYAEGGGVDQLLQNLKGSFSNLNQQVAAQASQQQAPANYQAMAQQATGEAPDAAYRRAVEQATLGRGYESLFPKAAAPTTPTAPTAPAAATPVEPTAQPGNAANNYSSWMTEILGGGGDGGSFKRGGRTNNMVERALAVTRRK